jgi:Fe(3+) dicitrate transport protein
MSKFSGVSVIAIVAAMGAAGQAAAQDSSLTATTVVDALIIAGSASQAQEIGGSADYVGQAELEANEYTDVNRVLRAVPGVYLQEEDGYGLRPNIGIRGSGTDRSARVAIMEDGVLIAPAPYSAAAAYYFPSVARMAGVEIVKGPAAIKYGPLTTGGAVHFFTPEIPEELGALGGYAEALVGDDNARQLEGLVGGWTQATAGWQLGGSVQALHDETEGFKQLDGGGDTGYEIDDLVFKIAARSDGPLPQLFQIKHQTYDEISNETYLGLTLADFMADPYRRYRGSQADVMNVDHTTWQATHRIDFTGNLSLTTVAYSNDTSRAWYKLNDVRSGGSFRAIGSVLADPVTFAEGYNTLVGAPGFTSAPDALRVRNNSRAYESQGIQTVLGIDFDAAGASHRLELSGRIHEDSEDRFQHDDLYQMDDGVMVLTTAGAPGTQANRIADAEALALFVRDTIDFGALTLTPGLRYETIDLRRRDYAPGDAVRATPTQARESEVEVWIPGLGAVWRANEAWQVFGGAHRGFANPGPGSTTDAETSWNYEAGVRYGQGSLSVEAIAFLNDYDNLVGTCTASTGGGCTIGDQFEAGEVEVKGLEFTIQNDFGAQLGWGLGVPVALTYTRTDGEFQTSFTSDYEPWGAVAAGDELPYLPEDQITLSAGLRAMRWRADVTVNHVSEARAVAGAGAIAANERIDARTLVDVAGEYFVTDSVSLFGAVANLTDEVYNVSFAPAGARPGAPRLAKGGLKVRF